MLNWSLATGRREGGYWACTLRAVWAVGSRWHQDVSLGAVGSCVWLPGLSYARLLSPRLYASPCVQQRHTGARNIARPHQGAQLLRAGAAAERGGG